MAPRPSLGWEERWPGMRGQNLGQGDSTTPRAGAQEHLQHLYQRPETGQLDQAPCCCQTGGSGQRCDRPGVVAPGFQGWLHPNGLCDLGPIRPPAPFSFTQGGVWTSEALSSSESLSQGLPLNTGRKENEREGGGRVSPRMQGGRSIPGGGGAVCRLSWAPWVAACGPRGSAAQLRLPPFYLYSTWPQRSPRDINRGATGVNKPQHLES